MAESCLFCQIVAKEIPADIVTETPEALALRDVNPQAPTHVLVIPKRHLRSLDEARDAKLLGELMLLAAQIARDAGVAATGYRVVANTNPDGGQSVYHFHLHLLGGRRMTWPPG